MQIIDSQDYRDCSQDYGRPGYQERYPEYSLPAIFISIISFFIPYIGIAGSIVSLVFAGKATRAYNDAPGRYRSNDLAVAAKIISIVGIILNILIFIGTFAFVFLLLSDPSYLDGIYQEFQEEIYEYQNGLDYVYSQLILR